VHILAKERYEVTNYKNVFIPTNLELSEAAKENFAPFYAALFDATIEKNKDADGRNPVVTEYSWIANSCDPCPGPAMQPQDAVTLGGDVLPSYAEQIKQGNLWALSDLTLTRLHARYDQSSLGEDLIFKEAPAVEGGRETGHGATKNYTDARPSSWGNNFQGRYIIRHAWEGEIKCQSPQRGIWGGPPGDPWGFSQPTAAKDLAFVPRDGIKLSSVLVEDVPALGIKAKPQKGPLKMLVKKKYEPTNVGGPAEKPVTEKPAAEAQGGSLNWGFIVAAVGGLILLVLVFSSRPKH
jgi:hypothetical protein